MVLLQFCVTKSFELFLEGFFHKNFLIVTCYTLSKVEIRASKQNSFKDQIKLMTVSNYLITIATINKDLLNKKFSVSIDVV